MAVLCGNQPRVLHWRDWGQVSAVAVFKRLRASERWLACLAKASWNQEVPSVAGRRLLAVDASTVREQEETGSLWRVHWCVDLSSLSCTHFELTDVHDGRQGVDTCEGPTMDSLVGNFPEPAFDHVQP